jgi:DNA-binding transcriptional ArsR family regulator
VNWEKLARAETHPLRVKLLEAIEESPEPLYSGDLTPMFDADGQSVKYHLSELEKAELLELDHTEQRRGKKARFFRVVSE